MTVRDRVITLIAGRAPDPLCDDCIAEILNLTVRQHANHKTRELAREPDFDRRTDVCSLCHREKLVIRYRLDAEPLEPMPRP